MRFAAASPGIRSRLRRAGEPRYLRRANQREQQSVRTDQQTRALCRLYAPLGTLRYAPRHSAPALDRYVHVSRIDIEATKAASNPLGSNERRPRAEKEIENKVATTRHVLDRIRAVSPSPPEDCPLCPVRPP